MAVASLALSFLAFIVPFGIASVVMGHVSRRQIAKSNGRQTGTWVAFAGLIISYLQFAVVALLCIALAGVWREMNRDLDRHWYTRAALLERLTYVRPSAAENRKNAVDAMRLIFARQTEYLSAHPDEGYACQLYLLGWDPATPSELRVHMVNSHYDIKIYQCRADAEHYNDRRFTVVAFPIGDSNPPDSPLYCVDQTGIVRKYGSDHANDVVAKTLYHGESCPQDGEAVE
jgi:hypothetical protein